MQHDKSIAHATVIHSHHYYELYKDENTPNLDVVRKAV